MGLTIKLTKPQQIAALSSLSIDEILEVLDNIDEQYGDWDITATFAEHFIEKCKKYVIEDFDKDDLEKYPNLTFLLFKKVDEEDLKTFLQIIEKLQ